MRVAHPLGLVSRDELEAVMYAVEAHQAHLEMTGEYAGREDAILEWFGQMLVMLDRALADEPVDRCVLDRLVEGAQEIGSVRAAQLGHDVYAEKREHLVEFLTRLTTATTEEDDEPVDSDEIYAVLSEQVELREQHRDQLLPHMRGTGVALEAVLHQWLADPVQVGVNDLLGVEAALRANHVAWIGAYGEDPLAGARQQRLTLLRRMRRQLGDGTWRQRGARFSRPPPSWPREWTTAEKLFTLEEAAGLLHKSPRTVRRWVHDGKLMGYRVGPQTWRIAESDLARLVSPERIQSWLSNRKGKDGLATAETGDSEAAEGRQLVRDNAVGGPLSDAGRKAQERWHLQSGAGRGGGDQEGNGRPRGWA